MRPLFASATATRGVKTLLAVGAARAPRRLFAPLDHAQDKDEEEVRPQDRRGAGRDGDAEDSRDAEAEQSADGAAPIAPSAAAPSSGTEVVPLFSHSEAAIATLAADRAALDSERAALDSERAALTQVRQRYERSLQELAKAQSLERVHLEGELVELAIEIAREVVQRELALDRSLVVRLASAALQVLTEPDAATLQVAPADLQLIEAARPELEHGRSGLLHIAADAALQPGECVVQSGRTRVDGRLEDRLERVRRALTGAITEAA